MAVTSNIKRNAPNSKRYNKKIKISYDRLELELIKNKDKLSSKGLFNTFVSGVVLIASFIATLCGSTFAQEWVKIVMLVIAGMATIYFVGYFYGYLVIERVSTNFWKCSKKITN